LKELFLRFASGCEQLDVFQQLILGRHADGEPGGPYNLIDNVSIHGSPKTALLQCNGGIAAFQASPVKRWECHTLDDSFQSREVSEAPYPGGVTAVPPGSAAHLIVRCWTFGVSPFAGEQ
jgi:hypothetical protein